MPYRKITVVEEEGLRGGTGGDCGRGWVRKPAVQMWCLGPVVAGPAGPLLLHCPKRVVSVIRLKGRDPPLNPSLPLVLCWENMAWMKEGVWWGSKCVCWHQNRSRSQGWKVSQVFRN